jgi:ferredoxin-NADP reductase
LKDQNVKFLGSKVVAEGTMAFEFSKPKGFEFQAGQSIDMTLGTQIYPFSIAASPNENLIRIVTRMRPESEFKKKLKKLKAGEKVRIQGPSGDFTLRKKSDKRLIFLAGGIGITPFSSMIAWAFQEKLPYKITLICGNSSKESAALLSDLEYVASQHANVDMQAIFHRLTKKDIPFDPNAVYYIAGPPGFVQNTRKILEDAAIDEDFIKTEQFDGY